MVIFKKVVDIQSFVLQNRTAGRTVAFIPTMGALHSGHTALVAAAKRDGHMTVASIFVNPTQFNDKADFQKYPTSVDADIAMLAATGCDVLFLPPVEEVYPQGTDSMPVYEFGYLDTVLEGARRPGHFKGVGQVVARLLDIVKPDKLYMGQKDYQQCMVVRNLLQQTGSHAEMIINPTVREADGLAMSSRNRRLTEPQRALAGTIYQCLVSIQAKGQQGGDFKIVQKECEDLLVDKGFKPEYIALADADTLELLDNYDNNRKTVALIAAWLGDIRLIDNMPVNG